MDFITAQNRHQITFYSLQDKISSDNPLWFLEAFVGQLELDKLKFVVSELKTEDRTWFKKINLLQCTLYNHQHCIKLDALLKIKD